MEAISLFNNLRNSGNDFAVESRFNIASATFPLQDFNELHCSKIIK